MFDLFLCIASFNLFLLLYNKLLDDCAYCEAFFLFYSGPVLKSLLFKRLSIIR